MRGSPIGECRLEKKNGREDKTILGAHFQFGRKGFNRGRHSSLEQAVQREKDLYLGKRS